MEVRVLSRAQNMLYTGKGDDGMTEIFGCDQQKISKSSEVPEALGALDELNAFLGFVKARAVGEPRVVNALREVQENLFIIQAEIAGANKRLVPEAVGKMEKMISEIEKEIPPIVGFSIAGGTELSALLDVLIHFSHAHYRAFNLSDLYIRHINCVNTASVHYKEGISDSQISHMDYAGFIYTHLHRIKLCSLGSFLIGLYGQCETQLHLSVVHCIPIGLNSFRVKGYIKLSFTHRIQT